MELPTDIIREVAKFLDQYELVQFANTCKYLNEKRPTIYSVVESGEINKFTDVETFVRTFACIKNLKVSSTLLHSELELVQRLPLRDLTIQHDFELTDAIKFPHLERLHVQNTKILYYLECPKLKRLQYDIYDSLDSLKIVHDMKLDEVEGPLHYSDDHIRDIPYVSTTIPEDNLCVELVSKMPIKKLSIFDVEQDADLSLLKLLALEEIYLNNLERTEEYMEVIADMPIRKLAVRQRLSYRVPCLKFPQLTFLDIDNCSVNFRNFSELRLKTLILRQCALEGKFLERMPPTIEELHLTCYDVIGDVPVLPNFKLLKKHPLRKLVLINHVNMNSYKIRHLPDTLEELEVTSLFVRSDLILKDLKLKKLSITCNQLSNEILHQISQMPLTELSLISCELFNWQIDLISNLKLRLLNLSDNRISFKILPLIKRMNVRKFICDTIKLA